MASSGLAAVCLAATAAVALSSAPAFAAPAQSLVHVRAAEEGRGVLRERNGECFVVTPAHVVAAAGEIRLAGHARAESAARFESRYPPDVAVLRVEQPGRLGCGVLWDTGHALDDALGAVDEAVVVGRNGAGALERRFVRVTGFDHRTIRVRARAEGDAFFAGLSGSVLEAGGRPLGMLVRVDPERGTGIVFRQDYLSDLIARFFEVEAPSAPIAAAGYHVTPLDFPALATRAASMRSEPDVLAGTVRNLSVGEAVTVTGRVSERLWYRVTDAQGRKGFVPIRSLDPL